MEGEIDGAVFLSISPEIPSGLEDLQVSIESNRLNTSSSVQKISSDISLVLLEKLCRVSGGTDGLKL